MITERKNLKKRSVDTRSGKDAEQQIAETLRMFEERQHD